jgi:hypothetical protein
MPPGYLVPPSQYDWDTSRSQDLGDFLSQQFLCSFKIFIVAQDVAGIVYGQLEMDRQIAHGLLDVFRPVHGPGSSAVPSYSFVARKSKEGYAFHVDTLEVERLHILVPSEVLESLTVHAAFPPLPVI